MDTENTGMLLQRTAELERELAAKNRELEIEAALERVRAKAMSMHSSEDLAETIEMIYRRISSLGVRPRRCGVGLVNKATRATELFTMNTTEKGETIEVIGHFTMGGHPVLEGVFDSWLEQKEYRPVLRGNEIEEYYKFIRPHIPFPDYPNDAVQYGYFFPFTEGSVYAWTDQELREEELMIYRKFTSVLSLTYKRYNDLKKAEAQALRAERDLIEIKVARKKAENALAALKATQQQLIQAEKMASLGELTAGIAHEIQNPLNFINNFSGVNKELVAELRQQLKHRNYEEAEALAADLEANEEKIVHHGKRADSIVKGMLQHARASSGKKEPTDINKLADEYLRLSYQGMRAKDKSFNAAIEINLDATLGPVNVAAQDIGRVLLNLFNNAFYAVSEKKAKLNGQYEPVVSVSTRLANDKIEIVVKDNGTGMSQKVVEKVFQPFFTTKPTGEGTGLGLSLSYDIITKGHSGELKVATKEGEGTVFIVQLPTSAQ